MFLYLPQSRQDVPFLGLCFWSAHTQKLLGTENWNGPFQMLSEPLAYSRPCAHQGLSHTSALGNSGRGGGVTSMNAPGMSSSLCSPLFPLEIPSPAANSVWAGTLPPHCFPCPAEVLRGFWKSCWPSIASTVKRCLHWPRLIFVCSNLSPGLPAGEGASLFSG